MNNAFVLAYPYINSIKNRVRFQERGDKIKAVLLTLLGLVFWGGIFVVFYLVLDYFAGIEIFGRILAQKLLTMVFLTFLSILIFSNTITALSTYFLSDDLQLIMSVPVSSTKIYLIKYMETVVNSSWMVVVFATPVFLAYGVVYHAGITYYLQLIAVMIVFLLIPDKSW